MSDEPTTEALDGIDVSDGDAALNKGLAQQQIRNEVSIAAPYVGHFQPRIVFEFLWSFAGWATVGTLGLLGVTPYWVSVPVAAVFVFCLYMPMHEATHNNIQGRRENLAWVNSLVGHLSSIPQMFDFPAHRMTHMAHHAFTNDPIKDPDSVSAGSFAKVFAVSLLSLPLILIVFGIAAWIPASRKKIEEDLEKSLGPVKAKLSLIYSRRFATFCIGFVVISVVAGYALEVLTFWLLPALLGLLVTNMIFAWLPHHPHNGHGRYTNTRVTLYPLSGLIGRGHDRHIIHHMLPGVPHYHIHRVFEALRPILEARGTRIEGPGAGKDAAKIFLGTDTALINEIGREAELADARPFTNPG